MDNLKEEFEFFWESDSPYSNWYKVEFVLNGIKFNCSEQAMMYGKAICFNDTETAEKILKEKNPRKQKQLGREVKNFEPLIWENSCKEIVYNACKAKFTQNPELLEILLSTENKILVEASPFDKIWGIGLLATDERAQDKKTWQGKNWLGEVLTKLRDDLKKEKNI